MRQISQAAPGVAQGRQHLASEYASLNTWCRHHLVKGAKKPHISHKSSPTAKLARYRIAVAQGQWLHLNLMMDGRFK
jgi:hypothetical protein